MKSAMPFASNFQLAIVRAAHGAAVAVFSATLACSHGAAVSRSPATVAEERIIFQDHFGPASRAARLDNLVQLPPPKGLGFETPYPFGFQPTRWKQVDGRSPDDPLRGFWIVAPEGEFLVQAGRSLPSLVFADTPVPTSIVAYDVMFRQFRADNDPISFVIGAQRADMDHGGVEVVVHQTQRPGTDETTPDLHVTGALGERVVAGRAGMFTWKQHVLEVRGTHVRWLQDDEVMAEGDVPSLRRGGLFGIRHQAERNTRYDDVRIVAR